MSEALHLVEGNIYKTIDNIITHGKIPKDKKDNIMVPYGKPVKFLKFVGLGKDMALIEYNGHTQFCRVDNLEEQ